MITNVEAFTSLAGLIEERGHEYSQAELSPKDSHEQPDTVAAIGLEATSPITSQPLNGQQLSGVVAVRAAQFLPEAVELMCGTRWGKALWLVRSTLTFEVSSQQAGAITKPFTNQMNTLSRRQGIPTLDIGSYAASRHVGMHTATAAYLLAPDDPMTIDVYYSTSDDQYLDWAHQNGEHITECPEKPAVMEANYFHSVPDKATENGADCVIKNGKTPRAAMVKSFLGPGPSFDPTAMISDTSTGIIHPTELPRTISWLMRNTAQIL